MYLPSCSVSPETAVITVKAQIRKDVTVQVMVTVLTQSIIYPRT